MARCTVDDIDRVLVDEMLVNGYSKEARATMEKGVRKAANLMRRQTVAEACVDGGKWRPRFSPHRAGGTFKRHIATKQGVNTPDAYSRIWYVKSPEYRLTHLLEHGHRLYIFGRDAKRRTRAFGFVGRARDNAESEFLRYLKGHL